MGITIGNRNRTLDMGYGGFYNLRRNIAGIYSEEFKSLYEAWCSPVGRLSNEEGNEQLAELYSRGILCDDDDIVLDFLFASDSDGKISVKGCRRLYEVIADYDDDICYGYIARPDCAKFIDFKKIVEDCAKNRLVLKWY